VTVLGSGSLRLANNKSVRHEPPSFFLPLDADSGRMHAHLGAAAQMLDAAVERE
jgi:hypothetical protein